MLLDSISAVNLSLGRIVLKSSSRVWMCVCEWSRISVVCHPRIRNN